MPRRAGKQLPAQPKRQQQTGGKPFTGVVAERHATESGAEYLRLTFGQPAGGSAEVDDPSRVIDAEFLFPAGALRFAQDPTASQTEHQLYSALDNSTR